MKRVLVLSLLFFSCSKSSSPGNSNAQFTYEVKTSGIPSWFAVFSDAMGNTVKGSNESVTTWDTTFTNKVSGSRGLSLGMTVAQFPANLSAPLSAILTIYVNGKIVKSDTTTGTASAGFVTPILTYVLPQ